MEIILTMTLLHITLYIFLYWHSSSKKGRCPMLLLCKIQDETNRDEKITKVRNKMSDLPYTRKHCIFVISLDDIVFTEKLLSFLLIIIAIIIYNY